MVGCRGGGMSAERSIVARTVEDLLVHASNVSVEAVDCNFCGGSECSPYDSVDEWRIVKCKRCGFCYTNPRPTIESLRSFYDLSYFKDDDVKRFGFFNEDGSQRLAIDTDYYQRIVDIEPWVNKRGGLLEVGAAVGEFLSVMRARGWKVSGVEVSRDAVEVAKKNREVDIFCGMLEEFETTETYDVVCMYHSLEHTSNPAFVIDRAYGLLNPGGIVVIEVPNLEGFDARISRERKLLSYDLPRHLSHFTPAVLSSELERKGFQILDVDLYYPDFILRLAKVRAARRHSGVYKGVINSRIQNAAQPKITSMATKDINWKTKLLKYVSRLFPGWRFTIVARK
jgi:SAM-dependent methyltransferase